MSPPKIRPMPVSGPSERMPKKVELAIVGAGFAGLSAALAASRSGMQALIVESGAVGSGQSGSCGGQIIAGFECDPSDLIGSLGMERAQRLMSASQRARDALGAEIETDPACGLRRGGLALAQGPGQDADLILEAEALARLGEPSEGVGAAQLGSRVGSPLYTSALSMPSTLHANPMAACQALGRSARLAGALIHERTRALKISRQGSEWLLETDRGPLLADKLFLAGGGSELLAHRWASPTALVRTWMAATEELPEDLLASLLPRGDCAFDCQELTMDFFRIEGRRLLLGGGDAIAASGSRGERYLRTRLAKIFPQLQGARVEEAWSGMADVSATRMPYLSRREGLWMACGYSGHGIANAFGAGQWAVESMLGDAGAWSAMEGMASPRFPAWPKARELSGWIGAAALRAFSR